MTRRVLIAGVTDSHSLEMSYCKAFLNAGYEVKLYDTALAVKKYARLGKLGYRIHQFFPVEAWLKKANKEFTEEVKLFMPDILMVFSGAEILPGSFAYIKSILPTHIIWYWADPLPNLSRYLLQSVPPIQNPLRIATGPDRRRAPACDERIARSASCRSAWRTRSPSLASSRRRR